MRVLVLGAGVTGVATAWYLCQAGHTVTVVDRRSGPGLETSFANGCQISPCHAEPWAKPSILPKIFEWLGREDAPLLFRWGRFDPALWRWCVDFLGNCRSSRAALNTERTLRIALYSRRCLQALRAEIGIEYDQKTLGILHVYRKSKDFEHACRVAGLMNRFGLQRQEKSPQDCIALEPALTEVETQLAGGIYTPGDESGDVYRFTHTLAKLAAHRGVQFLYDTTIQALRRDSDRLVGIESSRGFLAAEATVLAAGSYSPILARSVGVRLPIVPAKGYSITIPVRLGDCAPTVSLTDDAFKMVYSRLGDRLRVAGTAEMSGYDTTLPERRWRLLVERARALLPRAGDYSQAEPWTGLRPVTPDSVPLLGETPLSGLFLNTGHGTLGWTMACGSGRVIADLISQRTPEIDVVGLGIERFRYRLERPPPLR